MSFSNLGIRQEIISALSELEITTPTMIQAKAIPLIKQGKDVIGISKTGSGKTAAFSIPLLEKVQPRKGLQALIVTPTRELAVQISQEIYKFGKNLDIAVATVFGGVGMGPQIEAMETSEIVVGTPGRLLDHLGRGTMDLSQISFIVLDEADKMAEMGFIEDVSYLLDKTPEGSQIALFGATISSEVDRLKRGYMKDPQEVRAEEQVEEDLLSQFYYNVQPHDKFSLLVHLINKEKTGKVIIFCSSRRTVEIVSRNLSRYNLLVDMIHGNLPQNKRLKVIENFNSGKPNILVASAVASRGLDIKEVTHVFNYDLSQDPQEYVHRVGRTARAGESGKAITLLSQKDHDAFRTILRRYRLNVQQMPEEQFARLAFDARMHDEDRQGFRSQRFGGQGQGRPGFGGRFERREAGQEGGFGGNRFSSGRRTWRPNYR